MAEEKTTDKDGLLDDLDTSFDTQFKGDKMLGLGMNAIQPKGVDNTAIDTQISQIEKPASGSVYDKMAARYRSQGEGKVLRTQKNLNNLFGPTINLIKEREAAAEARFTLLKDKMPEFDDSTIFGNQSGNEMPIKDYVMGISKSVKEDLRMLSRLNINDERYDEVKKRVEKNQEAIVNFDEINKKLLEIRNSQDGREDHTQWSKGMDQTTIDMWTDIYSSKGENIKIVDGKLVWTDTRGESSYDFGSGDPRLGAKFEALGGTENHLGLLVRHTTDSKGKQMEFKNGDTHKAGPDGYLVSQVQTNLKAGGFTDGDGNELEVDNEWGPKSQAAYDKYLSEKDGLEKAYLDENLPEDSEYRKTSGTGGTKTIDLSQIGEGPTLIDNKGTNMDIALRGETQKFIEMGGKVDDPMYNQMIKSKLFELNKIGPQGFKSLIFDGIGLEDTDMFTGSNTDSFIEKVIADTYAGGDISKLSEKEIEGHIQEMKSGDVTLSYNTGEIDPETGEPVTSSLQSLFMKWYKGEIDDAITEGVKSKVVASSNQSNNNNNNNNNRRKKTTTTTTTPTDTNTNENDDFSAPFIERFGGDSNSMFSELTEKGAFGIDKDNILFNYDDSDYAGYNEGGLTVAGKLNESYGVDLNTIGDLEGTDVGSDGQRMSFYFEEVGSMDDVIRVHYRREDGSLVVKDYEIDTLDKSDAASATKMQKDMRLWVNQDLNKVKASKGADEVYVGEEGGDYNAETETETEIEEKKVTPPKVKSEIIKDLENIKVDKGLLEFQSNSSDHTDIDGSKVSFFVQIGVFENDVNAETLERINSIGGAAKILDKGNLYKYIAGAYGSLTEAEFREQEISQNSSSHLFRPFIYAVIDGKRVEVEDAITFLKK